MAIAPESVPEIFELNEVVEMGDEDGDKLAIAPPHWDNLFAPSSVLAIVTTVDEEGGVNAATFGTCTRVNHDPMYLAFTCNTSSDTYENVTHRGQFVVNLVPFSDHMLAKALEVGLPWRREIDELAVTGLTALPSSHVAPPRVAECYAHFESVVEWTREWQGRLMVCGRVVAVSSDRGVLDEDGWLVWQRARPAHYAGGRYRDQFVPAYEVTSVSWDASALAESGITDESFRSGWSDVRVLDTENPPVRDWRNLFRSAPARETEREGE